MIRFIDFKTDQSRVCQAIYQRGGKVKPHLTTSRGVTLDEPILVELKRFLSEFSAHLGVEKTPYYRIDAYFDIKTGSLFIIEVNACFVDGWGTALNLARASGIELTQEQKAALAFPTLFGIEDSSYRPELELLVRELEMVDPCFGEARISEDWQNETGLIYVYGRAGTRQRPNVLPFNGIELDHKSHLGRFSRLWQSEPVKLPRFYLHPEDSWKSLPERLVVKFYDKHDPQCTQMRATRSGVVFTLKSGASVYRKPYEQGRAFVQERLTPARDGHNNCQLIIMCVGNVPITGYVQYSPKAVINDDSMHGPLLLASTCP